MTKGKANGATISDARAFRLRSPVVTSPARVPSSVRPTAKRDELRRRAGTEAEGKDGQAGDPHLEAAAQEEATPLGLQLPKGKRQAHREKKQQGPGLCDPLYLDFVGDPAQEARPQHHPGGEIAHQEGEAQSLAEKPDEKAGHHDDE